MKNIILSLLLILSVAACDNKQEQIPTNEKPTIKIGAILPLTGSNALVGQPIKGALEIAIRKANIQDNKYQYEVIFEDSQTNSARTSTAMNKLINIDKVDAIISIFSNIGHIVSQSAEKNNIIHIALASDPNVAKGKYNFNNWTMPEFESKKMVENIKARGYKNVVLVALNQEGTIAVANAIGQDLDRINIQNRIMIINPGSRDMRLDIKKIQNARVDLYISVLYNPEGPIFIKQLRESGDNTDITAIEAFNFIEDKAIIEGQWFVDAGIKDINVVKEITEHNNSEVTYGVGNMYDNIMLITKAFEKAEAKKEAVDELLKIKTYDGVTGHLVQDENGIFQSEAVVKKIINGKIVVIEE